MTELGAPEAALVIRPSPESTGRDRVSADDPMGDVASIVREAEAAGLDARRRAYVSVYMRFAARDSWQAAAQAAASSWEVAAYGTAEGHMLRLSRFLQLTARGLAKVRSDALAFAVKNECAWLSVSIEDLQQAPTAWESLTSREAVQPPAQRTPPKVEAGEQTQRMQRGGTA